MRLHKPNNAQLPETIASWSLALIGLANIGGSLVAGQWVS